MLRRQKTGKARVVVHYKTFNLAASFRPLPQREPNLVEPVGGPMVVFKYRDLTFCQFFFSKEMRKLTEVWTLM